MSKRGTGGMLKSFAALLTGRGNTSMRPGGSHSSLENGSGLVLLLRSHGMEEGHAGLH
jgi:hypothetical protein